MVEEAAVEADGMRDKQERQVVALGIGCCDKVDGVEAGDASNSRKVEGQGIHSSGNVEEHRGNGGSIQRAEVDNVEHDGTEVDNWEGLSLKEIDLIFGN